MENWTCGSCGTQNAASHDQCQVCDERRVVGPQVPVVPIIPSTGPPPPTMPSVGVPPTSTAPPASATRASGTSSAPLGATPASGAAGRSPWIVVGAIALLVVAVVAIGVAMTSNRDASGNDADALETEVVSSLPPDSANEAGGSSDQTSSTTEAVLVETTTTMPSTTTTSPPTLVTNAASGAEATLVAATFEQYFTSINAHDYDRFYATYSPAYQAKHPLNELIPDMDTTYDESIVLERVSAGAGGPATAVVSFTSHQEDADSKQGTTCTVWHIEYDLVAVGGAWRIDGASGVDGDEPSRPC